MNPGVRVRKSSLPRKEIWYQGHEPGTGTGTGTHPHKQGLFCGSHDVRRVVHGAVKGLH